MAFTIDEKLIELENALIQAFPARLQKDPYTKMQFREGVNQQDDLETIIFSLKITGAIINFSCALDIKKFILRTTTLKFEKEFKKIKDIIKFLDRMDLNKPETFK